MNSVEPILKLLKLKPRYFFGAWIFGALLIFLPAHIKQQMGINIPDVVRPWLGFSTLAFFVLWIVLSAIQIFSFVSSLIKEKKIKEEVLTQLETLSSGERDIFILCLSRNQRTIQRNITDGPANSLKSKRLLVMASQGSVLSMPYTIPRFVWDYIKDKENELFPELFDQEAMLEFHRRQQNNWMRF